MESERTLSLRADDRASLTVMTFISDMVSLGFGLVLKCFLIFPATESWCSFSDKQSSCGCNVQFILWKQKKLDILLVWVIKEINEQIRFFIFVPNSYNDISGLMYASCLCQNEHFSGTKWLNQPLHSHLSHWELTPYLCFLYSAAVFKFCFLCTLLSCFCWCVCFAHSLYALLFLFIFSILLHLLK